ncbi:MAG: hypothetical protein IPM22_10615 [Betaproteobacteria bacterium]|nr:hypothetical protein [Betaproteobacteria bacterium]
MFEVDRKRIVVDATEAKPTTLAQSGRFLAGATDPQPAPVTGRARRRELARHTGRGWPAAGTPGTNRPCGVAARLEEKGCPGRNRRAGGAAA